MSRRAWIRKAALWVWNYHATLGGKLLIGGWFLSTLVSAAAMDIPVYRFVCAWTAPGVVAWLVGMALRPRLQPIAQIPARATAGETLPIDVRLRNASPRNAYDVGAGWFGLPAGLSQVKQDEAVSVLAPGAEATITVRLNALRRGIYRLPILRVYSLFPFGFFRIPAGRLRATRLLVRPAFHPLTALPLPMSNRYQPGGVAQYTRVGASPEYIGNREYRAGDSPRRLDFRAWARLSRPVVREFQDEYYCRVALVLDTRAPGAQKAPPGGVPAMEAAVALTAACAEALSRGDYLVDLFAAGPELHIFRAGQHQAHLDSILDLLAGIEATREDPFGTVAPALSMELRHIAAVVFVLLDWDAARERLVRTAVEAGCRVKVLVVRDTDTTLSPGSGGPLPGEHTRLTPGSVLQGGVTSV
jgi:uncharacterized protein (DUF58 family)